MTEYLQIKLTSNMTRLSQSQ